MRLLLCLILSSIPGLAVAATPAPTSTADALSRLRADVEHLSADDFGGRDTGSVHVHATEEIVASRFRALGLEPLPGSDSYFTPFELERDGFDRSCTRVVVSTAEGTMPLMPETDYRPFDFSDEGHVDVPLVFAGYGITATEHGWDDYAGLDVKGKAVLVLRHEPHENDPSSPFGGLESTQHASFSEKAAIARKNGALALLVVTDPLHHPPGDDLRWGGALRLKGGAQRPGRGGGARPQATPAPDVGGASGAGEAVEAPLLAIQISRDIAERLVRSTGRSLAELQIAVDEGESLKLEPLGRILMDVGRGQSPEIVHARNVAGVLPGSDLKLADEWIVIGAHHDHVGMFHGPGDTIFNGADDNATGTSAVLELARRFATAAERPRRSLVFVTFAAEEKGLLGSKHLVEQGILPRENLVFMLNNDMLGRNPERPIEAVGDGYASGLRSVIEASAEGLGLSLQYAGDGYFGASDHEPFYEVDVPFLFFFTGTHEDYHQVGDHADKIDFDRLARLVDLEERLLQRLAAADSPPRFVHHVAWLGAKAEIVEREGREQAIFTMVDEGSRAARQGLRAGDVVKAVNDTEIAGASGPGLGLGKALRSIAPGSTGSMLVLREGEQVALSIERAKPGWLGVFPAALEADERKRLGIREDEGLILRTVVPDGPAAKSGLMAGDVLLRIGGKPVNQRQLTARLAQVGAGETVPATVLRDGKSIEVPLTLGERGAR